MKPPRISIRLDNPCTQKLADMTPSEQGNFCAQCQKHVIDVSSMTDNELIEFAKKHQEGFCGQFSPEQLNRPLIPTELKGKTWRLNALFAGLALAGAAESVNAQTDTATSAPKVVINEKHPTGPVCIRQKQVDTTDLVVNVHVRDSVEHQNVNSARVLIQHGKVQYSGITDDKGNVRIVIPYEQLSDSMNITVSVIGYMAYTTSISTADRNQKVRVDLTQMHYLILGGAGIMIEPEPVKVKQKPFIRFRDDE